MLISYAIFIIFAQFCLEYFPFSYQIMLFFNRISSWTYGLLFQMKTCTSHKSILHAIKYTDGSPWISSTHKHLPISGKNVSTEEPTVPSKTVLIITLWTNASYKYSNEKVPAPQKIYISHAASLKWSITRTCLSPSVLLPLDRYLQDKEKIL